MSKPIGTAPLREIAAGKKTVAITFGEMSRPTPTYEIVPWVLDQLTAAGIRDENILFIAALANHRPMTQTEVATKLGMAVIRKHPWINHSCFYGCKEIGTTSRKTNVMVNQNFMDADLKITLSGIKVHFDAGYGGGAKMVLPGVAHIDTMEHNHNVVLRETKTSGPVKIFKNEMRLDINEAACLAKARRDIGLIVYSQYMTRSFMNGFAPGAQFASSWEEVVKMLQERHKGPSVRVAVYPYAGIQHEEIELDS